MKLMRFAEGVLVAKKDFNLPKHNEIDTKNLYVGTL
jgi:small subunit ribosomal protein S10e